MDLNNAYTQAGVTGSIIFAGGILYKIYRAVNGKKIHSKCCDKDIEFGVSVEEMSPTHPKENVVIQNPPPPPPSHQLNPTHS